MNYTGKLTTQQLYHLNALPTTAKEFKKYFNYLENSALKSEINAYYRFQCTAMKQELGSRCQLFVFSGFQLESSQMTDVLLSLADAATARSQSQPSAESFNAEPVSASQASPVGHVRLCSFMAYYADNPATGARQRRQVDFASASAIAAAAYRLPEGLPEAFRDMRLEKNRLITFLSAPLNRLETPTPAAVKAAAAVGLYFTGRIRHPLRCAFCGCSVKFDSNSTCSPADCHLRDHPECPLLLGFNVGNIPEVIDVQSGSAADKHPVQCTESSGPINRANLAMGGRAAGPVERLAYDSALFCGWAEAGCPSSTAAAAAAAADAPGGLASLASRRAASRQASLQSSRWPTGLASAWLAAKSGFTAESAAAARCYACGVEFPPGDLLPAGRPCPWLLHARLSPRCPHLLAERGRRFVDAVLAEFGPIKIVVNDADWPPERRRLLCGSSVASAALLFRFDRRAPRARCDLPAARLAARLADAADRQADAEAAHRLQLAFAGDDFSSAELLLESALELRRRADDLGLASVADLAEDRLAAAEKRRQLAAAVASASGTSPAALHCHRCGCSEAACCLLPCSHRCLCPACEAQSASCPVCGAEIQAVCLLRGA